MATLLGKSKQFFKANLHAHTHLSDGRLSPEELKEEYKKRGYSVVAFTDHEHIIDNSHLADEEFLPLTACEIAIKDGDPTSSTLKSPGLKVCHLNFYSFDPHNTVTPFYNKFYDKFLNEYSSPLVAPHQDHDRVYGAEGINEIIKGATEQGFLVSYNHPSWSLENAFDYIELKGLFAVEIYNHSCNRLGFPDDEPVYDHLLRRGNRLFCTATDDCDDKSPIGTAANDSFGGWVMIDAPKLDYQSIMDALKNGNFYSSTGPEIHKITIKEDKLTVKCSDAKSIHLITGGRRTAAKFSENGDSLNKATFPLRDTDNYVRIRIQDSFGKKAYTNAYFL